MINRPSDKLKKIGHGLPIPLQLAIRLPFSFLAAYEDFLAWREKRKGLSSAPCRSVSIIIPTVNEERYIVPCLQAFSGNAHVLETIVVDGGSGDQTCLLAEQNGARIILHDKPVYKGGGRGGQVKAGINAAAGDVVMILHADTLLPGNEIERMLDVLNKSPGVIGGAVGGRFDSAQFRFRILELANDVRAAFFKISFGDQVQFFRRQPVVNRDLFPGIALMEDVEFAIRLHRLGRQTFLSGKALVSTRRWDRIGSRNAPWILMQVTAYLMRRLWSQPDTNRLYRTYYNRD